MMRARGVVLMGVLSCAWLGRPSPLAAQPSGRAAVEAASADVASGEIARMQRGLSALAASQSSAAVAPIEALLRRGPPAPVLLPAIEALGALGDPEAVPVLASLLRHHRADARARAAVALGPLRSERTSTALAIALGDPDAGVRAAAARALATAGTPSAIPTLLAALARGNLEAAPALGSIGDVHTLEQLVALGDQVPHDALIEAARALFERPGTQTRTLMASVDLLATVGGPEIVAFLTELRAARARTRPLVARIDAALARAEHAGSAP